MKKVVRFVEQVTVKQTVVVEQIGNSHSESNFIEIDPTNELLPHYLPVFPTVDECYEDEGPTAIHCLSVLPTVESTTYHTLLSPATDFNRRYRSCRWRINKKDMDDMTPILPLRQDSISKELFNPDQHHDVLRPSNAYNWKKNHDSISKQLLSLISIRMCYHQVKRIVSAKNFLSLISIMLCYHQVMRIMGRRIALLNLSMYNTERGPDEKRW